MINPMEMPNVENLRDSALEEMRLEKLIAKQVEEAEHPTIVLERRLKDPEVFERLVDNYWEHVSTGGKMPNLIDTKSSSEENFYILWENKSQIRNYLTILLGEKEGQGIFNKTDISFAEIPSGIFATSVNNKESGFEGFNTSEDDKIDPNQTVKYHGGVFINARHASGKKPSQSFLKKNEAHETGHLSRSYMETSKFTERLQRVFDFESSRTYSINREGFRELEKNMGQTYLEYLGDPQEILERMAELKNYFGFENGQEFTKGHLDYARRNYAKTKDNLTDMDIFFESISDDKEGDFLDLMNNTVAV